MLTSGGSELTDHYDRPYQKPFGEPNLGIRLVLIGRFDRARWVKGGILASCNQLADGLERLGAQVSRIDIDSPLISIKDAFLSKPDAVVIYAGAWDSQDALSLRFCLNVASEVKCPVYFNAVWDNSESSRTQLLALHSSASGNVGFFIFSQAAKTSLEDLTGRPVLVLPKPLRAVRTKSARSVNQANNLFLGDISKFLRPEIAPKAREYWEALIELIPPKRLIFVRQYMPASVPNWLRGAEIRPFTPGLGDLFLGVRAYIHVNEYATFEMLPLEAFGMGIPLVSAPMPHSLDEIIPSELRHTVLSPEQMRFEVEKLIENRVSDQRISQQVRTYEDFRRSWLTSLNQSFLLALIEHSESGRIS